MTTDETQTAQRKALYRRPQALLDVRTHAEFDEASIEGCEHIPLGALRGRLDELPRDKETITFSRVSLSGYEAAFILKAAGFQDVKVMDGGIIMWPRGAAPQ